MIGPPPTARGGIATVIAQYRDNGLFEALDVIYLPTFSAGRPWEKLQVVTLSLLRFFALLLRRRVGVVHIHTASFTSFYRKALFAWLAYFFGRPVVLHIHGGKFIEFATSGSPIARAFIARTLRRASRLIALSEHWAMRFRDELGIGRDRIAVVPNPISIAERSSVRPEPRQLLFLGDIIRKKGVYELVDALALLKQRGVPARLRCGGLGEIDALKSYATERRVQDELTMLGWIDAAAKADELRRADLFVLPSYVEGLPMTILEAMAAGVPVLASNVGGIPDMLRHGALGELIPSEDSVQLAAAIERNFREPAAMRQKAELAYGAIQQYYAPAVVCAQLAGLYEAID